MPERFDSPFYRKKPNYEEISRYIKRNPKACTDLCSAGITAFGNRTAPKIYFHWQGVRFAGRWTNFRF